MDVNQGAATPVESASSPSPTQSQPAQSQTSQTPPPGALNTDQSANPIPETIPYQRFKEVNDSLKSYKDREATWKSYEMLDQVLDQRPDLVMVLGQALGINPQVLAQQMGYQQPQQPQQQLQNVQFQQQLQPQFQQQQAAPSDPVLRENMYRTTFREKAKADNIPQELIPELESYAQYLLMQKNPDPLGNFNLGMLDEVYVSMKGMIDKITNTKAASYLTQKQTNGVPPSTSKTGAPVSAQPQKIVGQESRASRLAQLMTTGIQPGA